MPQIIPTSTERQLDGETGRPSQAPTSASRNDPVDYLLHTLDLTSLTNHLRPILAISVTRLAALILEYRRFLVLKYTQRDTSESATSTVWCPPLLHCVWDEHILDTRAYRTMCAVIGEWIDHDRDEEDRDEAAARRRRRSLLRRIDATLACYKNHFDEDPPATVWSMTAGRDVIDSFLGSMAGIRIVEDARAPSVTRSAVGAQPQANSSLLPRADVIRLFVTPVSSYTNISTGSTLQSDTFVPGSFTVLVRPRTPFSKIFQSIAERIERNNKDEIVCIKTGVVAPLDDWERALVLQRETLIRSSEPQWVETSVGDIGFVNDEHVLVLCVAREVEVVER